MASSNPFLTASNSRDKYTKVLEEDEDERESKAPTSSGNPFLDSINTSTNSRIKTKKQEEDEKARKRLDELASIEKNAPKQKGLLESIGEGITKVTKPISQGGINVFADAGNFVKDQVVAPVVKDATTAFNQARTSAEAQKNNEGQGFASEKWLQNQNAEIDRALKAGEIDKKKAEAYRKDAQGKVQKTKESVKKAEQTTGHTYNQDEGAVAAVSTAANALGTDKLIEATGKAVFNAGAKVVGKATEKKTAKNLASQEAIEAAEDAAKLESAGITPISKNASQSLTTPPAGTMPKTVEARKNQGFLADDVLPNGQSTNQIGNAVENVATPNGQTPTIPGTAASRYVSKTIPESEFVGGELKKKVGAEYEQTTNAVRADTSLQKLDVEGVDNFTTTVKERLASKQVTDQTVFDAQAAAQALEKRGTPRDLQDAADIYNQLSTHLSKAGQTVQAAAIMSRQSPQGLSYYAQKQFKNAGVEFTPKLQQELKKYVDAVKNAPPKSDEMAIARDNVQYFIAQNLPSDTADKVVNFWRAGLLTGPTTSGGAIVGNIGQTIGRKLVTNPVSTLADWVQSFFTGERAQTLAKAGEGLKGAKVGAKNATSKQYWKTGYNPADAGDATGKFDQKNRMLNYGDGVLGKATGKYVNGVYQLMGALDQPFRAGAQREALSSMANAAVKNNKLKGDEAKAFYDDFMKNPPTEALERSTAEAKREVFANDTVLSKVVQGAKQKLRQDGHTKAAAVVDFFVPFSKVPSAVATRIIDQTPIGTAKEIVKQIVNVRKGGKYDQRAMSRAIGEGTMALPVLGAGYALAQQGEITGGYPSSKEERDRWQREGKQPNSIRVGDRWYSMNYVQPFGTIMSMGAGLADAEKSGANIEGMITEAIASGGKSFINQSFLQGISSGLDAVNNPVEFAGRYVANTAAGIIPNAIRAGTRAADPLQRETEGIEAGIKSGIPGLRETLPVKLDADGKPLEAKDNFANQYFNPLKPSKATPDQDTDFNDKAIMPASKLKARRTTEINDLLGQSKVAAAQKKIDKYNEDVARVIAPFIEQNRGSISQEQLDRIDKLFMGEVWINKKGRPTISSRDDLPE